MTLETNEEDLELLFDSILANIAPDTVVTTSALLDEGNESAQSRMVNQLGKITRTLHDTLRELGLNKRIEEVASNIPDARDRLNYVANLTRQAAERVLNATEAAQPLVQNMELEAQQLDMAWEKMLAGQLSLTEFKTLVMHNRAFLQQLPVVTRAANGYLMEIMMAQDFQDLTGQVIKKIIDLTQNMETQLLALLLENAPELKCETGGLAGPVIHSASVNVLTGQDQVDDLLESLGF